MRMNERTNGDNSKLMDVKRGRGCDKLLMVKDQKFLLCIDYRYLKIGRNNFFVAKCMLFQNVSKL